MGTLLIRLQVMCTASLGGRLLSEANASIVVLHCIALSSTEAEIIAASQAAVELVYLRGCLEEMGYKFSEPPTLYVDNTGAVALGEQ